MNNSWALVLIFIVSYFIGSINFARIVSWHGWHKKIEDSGSGNPGTMNMLRTYGLWAAILTLVLEVIKTGVTCLVAGILMRGRGLENLAFFFAGFAVVVGSIFPIWHNFKGGKGVACMFGCFVFSPLWYVALFLLFVGIVQLIWTGYGSVSSFIFLILINVANTIWLFVEHINYGWLICTLCWLLCILIFVKHKGNLVRLYHGTENKIDMRKAVSKKRRENVENQENKEEK